MLRIEQLWDQEGKNWDFHFGNEEFEISVRNLSKYIKYAVAYSSLEMERQVWVIYLDSEIFSV